MSTTQSVPVSTSPVAGVRDDGTVAVEAHLGRFALTGADAKAVGSAEVIPGLPLLFQIPIADASADTDVVTTYAIRVVDFWFRATGIAAHATDDTVQLKNGSNAISDAVAKTATVEQVVRAGTLAAARVDIAAGGTLRVTAVKATNVAGVAYVLAVRT